MLPAPSPTRMTQTAIKMEWTCAVSNYKQPRLPGTIPSHRTMKDEFFECHITGHVRMPISEAARVHRLFLC